MKVCKTTAIFLFVCSLSFASNAHAASVRDYFDAIAYNGNNGTASWTGNWIENGEADGPAAGFLHVVSGGSCTAGNCLRLGTDADIDIDQRILFREADLSGNASATLEYDFQAFNANLGFVRVETPAFGDYESQLGRDLTNRKSSANTCRPQTRVLPVRHFRVLR